MRKVITPFLLICFLVSYSLYLLQVGHPNCKLDEGYLRVWSNSTIGIFTVCLLVLGGVKDKVRVEREFYWLSVVTIAVVYGIIIARNMLWIGPARDRFLTFLLIETSMVIVSCISAHIHGLFTNKK